MSHAIRVAGRLRRCGTGSNKPAGIPDPPAFNSRTNQQTLQPHDPHKRQESQKFVVRRRMSWPAEHLAACRSFGMCLLDVLEERSGEVVSEIDVIPCCSWGGLGEHQLGPAAVEILNDGSQRLWRPNWLAWSGVESSTRLGWSAQSSMPLRTKTKTNAHIP